MKVLIATAMYPTEGNPAFGSFVRCQEIFLRRAGVDVDVLVLRGRYRKLIYPKGIFQLRQRLNDISLVHAHYAYVGLVARAQWQVPLVLTYHGDDALGTVTKEGSVSRKSRIVAAGCRKLAHYCDAVIVQSKRMAGKFQEECVHVIPHEVDLDKFHPTNINRAREQLGLSHSKNYVLFAADPAIPVKNFPLANAAAALLRTRTKDVELLVVCRETQERLALYMSACDALVFPSYQEGSPNIIKQAMACNLPIVATDVGDVEEIIGRTRGCYISQPNPEMFARFLGTILASPFRTAGRDEVKHLSGELVADRLIQVYEEVLRRRYTNSLSSLRF
ncbi:glycosyltransferase [Acidipila rosea]|uniref:Glycosyltransferase involved in cell wall biosynthesis n=1 Tax=Acidipila rosea TaxID=768535 RepID=A0A4R1KWP1_9BACT|nr:glycosyltransferase [Acidipila rosea]MBW4028281.1 glycosyltransferase family 4 protein [Acidobacteriota bacterium]TCK69678.1 glycosyltransferase involved in cell wall biosynthesis [Acidipila rosea]